MNYREARKFVVAVVVAVLIAALTAVESAMGDGVVTSQEWVTIALAALGAVMVYYVRNDRPAEEE